MKPPSEDDSTVLQTESAGGEHWRNCLRGELRSLQANVDALRSQIRALLGSAPVEEESKASRTQSSFGIPPSGTVHLPPQHLKLELQVQSQFRLLWAVFQSHSTAEDEMIWPALKEKARSSGGKLKLVSIGEEESEPGASDPGPPSGSSPPSSACPSGETAEPKTSVEASSGRNASDCASEKTAAGNGDRRVTECWGGFDEAMIDEREYAEEHSQEQRLFEGMQEALTRLRNTRQSLPERLDVMAGLSSKTEEMCLHLMTHLAKEEESALPLIKHYFTREEMEALVGKIMGKRPTELMQTILAMMIKNLPSDEVSKMMGYMRQAVKDTYFEKWLAAGGFQWPAEKAPYSAESKGNGCGMVGEKLFPPAALGSASALASTHAGGVLGRAPGGDGSSPRANKRPGSSLASCANRRRDWSTLIECSDGCFLRLEFTGMALNEDHGTKPSQRGGSGTEKLDGGTGEGDMPESDLPKKGDAKNDSCAMCSYAGRCPVSEPLSQEEFEVTVKKLAQADALSAEHKSSLIQALRNHMYQSRKRPRPGGDACSHDIGDPGDPPACTSGSEESVDRSSPSAGLVAPVRYYTSTQPDIEEPTLGTGGWDKDVVATASAVALLTSSQSQSVLKESKDTERREPEEGGVMSLSPPLFTPEELAPTYHVIGAASAGSSTSMAPASLEDGRVGAANGSVWGCPHYRRSCKIRAPCCQRLFTCRLCHDQASDHIMNREEVKEMLCMYCGTLQPVHSECRNPACRPPGVHDRGARGTKMARYYCGICHLFDDTPGKDIYHCPYCNICRLGKGLGEDFYHCMNCNACISLNAPKHNCFSKSLESDCPICGASLFTSTSQVKGLKCGHFMHLSCYKEYIRRADSQNFWYRCPICRKSIDDMEEYFSQIDAEVASQPMPESFAGHKMKVSCHDCEQYTNVPYHFVYLKCGACGSYNTRAEGKPFREAAEGPTAESRQ